MMKPSAVLAGSEVQKASVMEMMQSDITKMGRALEAVKEAAELGDKDACHEIARQCLETRTV